ncbi:GNAT family N-acetyltransferase [Burkholderia sp. LMG 13014]|uniref:GNAT family N-acetyltransferase n=1 Tax=Burkholderia sp. LMG 13014 TaxID=2709306 RepID=UPI001965A593|nr:GNAT family N-acetyltransferase [Burkholderia sp. LMG 13014]
MDVSFCVEPFESIYQELKPRLAQHYAEISLHADRGFELKPQEHVYRDRAARGELLMMIGRLRGEIVAYSVIFVAPGLHYADCLTAIGDIFYVAPDHRAGRVGSTLFAAVEAELRRRGVNLWTAGEKVKFPCGALMERAGMELAERTWFKWL